MPRFYDLKTNFASGELDPALYGRPDIKHYFNGAKKIRNAMVRPQGGVRLRPGSVFLDVVPEIPEGDGGGLSNVLLIPFEFSTVEKYMFVVYHKAAKIYRNGVEVATITLPYTSDEIPALFDSQNNLSSSGLWYTQSLDTLVLFHEDYQPRKIVRQGSHSSWSVSTWDFINIPRFAYGDTTYTNGVNEVQKVHFPTLSGGNFQPNDDTFSLTLEDEETDPIVFTSTDATLAARIQAALRKLPNTSATGITVTVASSRTFTVTFDGDDGNRPWGAMFAKTVSSEFQPEFQVTVTTDGEYPGEDVWSASRGWPRCGIFYQGRFILAGSKSRPQTVWASRAGDPTDMNTKRTAVDYGIDATPDGDTVAAFFHIAVGRHLQFFASSGEFYVPISDSEAITPQNFTLRQSTNAGVRPGLGVNIVEGATLFVQYSGKSLREFIYTDGEQAYAANNISLLATHLMRTPVSLCYRQATSTEDADYIMFANSDGTMSCFCTLRSQEVNAYSLFTTNGQYVAVAALRQEIYQIVKRSIDGVESLYFELQDNDIRFDCSVKAEGLGSPVSSVAVAHLGGETVEAMLDGSLIGELTPASGSVTLPRDAESSYVVGLPWPAVEGTYRWFVETLPPEVQLPEGTMVGRKMKIGGVSVTLSETTGIVVNGNRISFRKFGGSLLDQPIEPFTGTKRLRGFLGWSFGATIRLGDSSATDANVLSLAYPVSV